MKHKKYKKIQVFELNDEKEIYDELELDISVFTKLFNKNSVFLFINHNKKTVWIWLGKHITPRQRFMASYKSTPIRNIYGSSYNTKTAEQHFEPLSFKYMVGSDVDETKDLENFHVDKTGLGRFILDSRGGSIFILTEEWEKFKTSINKN